MADVLIHNHGSVVLLRPMTDAASDWIMNNTPDDAPTFGDALVVEPRYVLNIVVGMRADGLAVKGA